jgi:mannose-6-phosphate isomerase
MVTLTEDSAFQLTGAVQNYSWGGYNFIPALIGIKPKPDMPYAEYWMGAHEKAPSRILQNDTTTVALDRVIAEQPEKALGYPVAQKYGRLPYLFKILDVREILSIQVHPTKSAAEEGFARENEMDIPLNSPERNYKDDNHKPELQLALSTFWLLHGFRPKDQLCEMLNRIPEFYPLRPIFASSGYYGLYKYVMEMPSEAVNTILKPLAERILQKYNAGVLEESSPDYWAAKVIQQKPLANIDRGIFSIYFFNLVELKPGQAIFQDAGIPHAALQGQALEIMANSDNVIRGGLTPKYIDIPQLLKLVAFKSITPEIIENKQSDNPYEMFYESPSPDFRLSRIQLSKGDLYKNTTFSTEILLLLDGEIVLDTNDKDILIKKGESIIAFAEKSYRIKAISEHALLFRASIPVIH